MTGRADVPAVAVRGVRFAYPDGRVALDGVDLEVGPGERVAILGPNGAGKSTLVLHLNGILQAQRGEVAVGGLPVVKRNLAEVRRRVGIVFQDPDDQLFMPRVHDDVAFGLALSGLRDADLEGRVDGALAAVGMADRHRAAPHHLSFGQRRRVAIATVPDVLALDEPTANLDPRQARVRRARRRARQRRGARRRRRSAAPAVAARRQGRPAGRRRIAWRQGSTAPVGGCC